MAFQGGTRTSSFEDFEVEDRFFEGIEKVVNYINRTGKFRVIGWMKRGTVEDQGVHQPGTFNGPKVRVQSGNINHHITRVDPMMPQLIDKRHLDSLKFDTTNGFIV